MVEITASNIFGMMLQAWHTCIWGVSPILLLQILSSFVRLDEERGCTAIFRGSSPGSGWTPNDIQRLVPKPLLWCLSCVLRVVFLLEGQPSPQPEVLSVREPPPCFTVGMVPGFLQTRRLAFRSKSFNLGFIRPENLVSHGLRVFRCFLANSKWAVMCVLLRRGFSLATRP